MVTVCVLTLSAVPPFFSAEPPEPSNESMPPAIAVSQFLPVPNATMSAVLSVSPIRFASRAVLMTASSPTVTVLF